MSKGIRKGLRKENMRQHREYFSKHMKWFLIGGVAGIVLIIAILIIVISLVVNTRQARQTVEALKACLPDTKITSSITELVVPSGYCNTDDLNVLNFGKFKKLKTIEIGSSSFTHEHYCPDWFP